ncbi:MAG: heme NO-binding domain-containing protein [Pseudomonadota bacterium]|nr:heme NO-binding domain-containing protein [Pseudomonadota bacterium]
MKGAIFTSLAEMVEEKFDLNLWQNMLNSCPVSNGGGYSSGGIYPDSELMCLVGQLQKQLDVPVEDLLRSFGEYLFGNLSKLHSDYLLNHSTAKSFLLSVHDVIHTDIEKLYPGTSFPFIDYRDGGDNRLTIIYKSPRKLCFLAEGLIQGVAQKYACEAIIKHPVCMHNGDENCILEIEFREKSK